MSGSSSSIAPAVRNAFETASKSKPKRKPPVSVRFRDDELAQLHVWADGRPLGSVIREKLFGANAKKGRKVKPPPRQQKAMASALRRLGHAGIAAYLVGQITAVEEGRLLLSKHEERQLRNADRELFAIRRDLIIALGVDAEGPPS